MNTARRDDALQKGANASLRVIEQLAKLSDSLDDESKIYFWMGFLASLAGCMTRIFTKEPTQTMLRKVAKSLDAMTEDGELVQ